MVYHFIYVNPSLKKLVTKNEEIRLIEETPRKREKYTAASARQGR